MPTPFPSAAERHFIYRVFLLAILVPSVLVKPGFSQTRYGLDQVLVNRGNPDMPILVPDPVATFEDQRRIMESKQTPLKVDSGVTKTCFLPPLAGIRNTTVGIGTLEAKVESSSDYTKACSALAKQKFEAAEKYLQKSVASYPKDSELWVLLGQVLAKREQPAQASESCKRALATNPAYAPGYLCLADIAAHSSDWNEVLKLTDKVLALDPASSGISYAFNAGANFSLHHLAEAEKSALRALEFQSSVDIRQLHYLLAEIYEAKGDRPDEIAQLEEFVKASGDSSASVIVKQYLAKLSNAPGATPVNGAK